MPRHPDAPPSLARPALPRLATAALSTAATLAAAPVSAQPDEPIGAYFGFGEPRIVVIEEGCGPGIAADVNADGRPDLVVVNNRKSRIDILLLRESPLAEEDRARGARANELPPNPWYDTAEVSVSHQVGCVRAHDVDGDGLPDLVYVGEEPSELVVLRQRAPGEFAPMSRRRVRGLAGGQDSLAIADVTGDERPEVLALVEGRLAVFPLDTRGTLGEPALLGSGGSLRAIFPEDYDGDGLTDVLGAIPDDQAPLRLWLQSAAPGGRAGGGGGSPAKRGILSSELRFEMPNLSEAEPIRFPGRAGASIGVIERASRRMSFFDVVPQAVSTAMGAETEVQAEVVAFPDGANRARSVAVGDLDGDGLLDLLSTDQKSHTVLVYRQRPGVGLGEGSPHTTFKKPSGIALAHWGAGAGPEVFVLSEEEKAVGVSAFESGGEGEAGRVAFPVPIPIKTGGAAPVAMQAFELEGAPAAAVIVRDGRNLVLELHRPGGGDPAAIPLTGVSKPPKSILSADADHDGRADLLLFTPGEPMVMLRRAGDETSAWQLLTSKEMGQFGLVQAAGPANTALLDIAGDGNADLLIATANFVRGCIYDAARGWKVVEQISIPDPTADFAGVTLLRAGGETLIVAADKANGRLVIFGKDTEGRWGVRQRLKILGFTVGEVYAGSFAGDGQPSILCVADEGFAVVRLGGERVALRVFETFRPEARNRFEHEIEAGDVNGDGYTDIVVLDARERMCEIYTFSASRRLHVATEFEVFQARTFSRGDSPVYEPRWAIVADLTGDKAHDLALIVHDRVIVYPQGK